MKSDINIRDGYVEVDGKVLYGNFARVIGIIWRFQDEKNYYLLKASANTETIRAFRVVDGIRTAIESSSPQVYFTGDAWYLLRVEFSGNETRVMLNSNDVFTYTDDTFTEAGAVGLWNKWDSFVIYDNFSYGESIE